MKFNFPVILIIVSSAALLVSFFLIFLQHRKADTINKQVVQSFAKHVNFEVLFSIFSYSFILMGSIAFLYEKSWSKPMVVVALAALLLYVWVKNIWSIVYFRKLKSDKSEILKQEISTELTHMFEPLQSEINIEAVLGDGVYEYAADRNIKKAVGRLVVGTLLLGWGLMSAIYL